MNPAMPTITIDNQPYDLDALSPEAKAELQILHVTEQEIARLNLQLAIAQTARNANALKQRLPTPLEQAMCRETRSSSAEVVMAASVIFT